ncbi:tetratricopeptide repeat protein [Bradyrhizobium sp. U87765 SZCCT0131]|uniref:tetratricopeptide repeat protein n=1 Tax=unclassified Bradyrhizobium TaxID=2631580 RepID=UPI001BA4C3AB|nr:tetratricopeptide repeat protein [Bradyrhizobium sp. U87765 SZCCT0110]MBR1222964.1 tetratricopeptide repeat protein [Bradyrhizobium sp. U87765 SZCCT0131]MBR1262700.1 tetratricopeptide repeat protein [Bradyrhizobium sp. U87765 SZCCT0134]MBR1318482.1 tetratricopeptide repeat protein [Bradyrhizobium sp. U87765 SZCCT0109]MBR1352186.1 tetratricopeptide repeat protein [Bradyrhizobium sp. U87765 SZCCT0048]MBR1308828.1 tetratricopeptide repeat protein [Bradyrhizobium sp. U87765 SZCCT0110]
MTRATPTLVPLKLVTPPLVTRILTTATFLVALVASPLLANAAGNETPSSPPPSSDSKSNPPKKSKKSDKQSSIDSPAFLQGYRTAYATIYEHNDYTAAIAQLKALGQDDRADVANLIGYSYRKLGDYQTSQAWYERALAADPTHVKTWQYYGLWQVEQGHRDQARVNLAKIEQLCGTTCPEYRSLADAIDGTTTTARLVY